MISVEADIAEAQEALSGTSKSLAADHWQQGFFRTTIVHFLGFTQRFSPWQRTAA